MLFSQWWFCHFWVTPRSSVPDPVPIPLLRAFVLNSQSQCNKQQSFPWLPATKEGRAQSTIEGFLNSGLYEAELNRKQEAHSIKGGLLCYLQGADRCKVAMQRNCYHRHTSWDEGGRGYENLEGECCEEDASLRADFAGRKSEQCIPWPCSPPSL